MPAKNKPTPRGDYVGTYDGSKDKWMTRKMTDKGGRRRDSMAPVSSNPNESRDYFEGYNPDYNSQVTPGKFETIDNKKLTKQQQINRRNKKPM